MHREEYGILMRLTAVIFDWAGTVVDHGSYAPVITLQEVFAEAGLPITAAEARFRMGIAKRSHIASILEIPRVVGEWKRVHGSEPGEADTNRLYASFVPKQLACLARHSDVIEGVPAAVEQVRARELKVGSTTGYTRPMLDFLLAMAKAQGFSTDCSVCPEDVPGGGRPGPWMCYLNAIRLAAGPLWTMVKIGDTPSDIAEGLNAGMWTIGITRTGNEVGMTAAGWEEASGTEKADALEQAAGRLRQAGAHYLAESVADCVGILDQIDARLRAGERP
jgi:phosphonoacetaldehyde hydrolase